MDVCRYLCGTTGQGTIARSWKETRVSNEEGVPEISTPSKLLQIEITSVLALGQVAEVSVRIPYFLLLKDLRKI